MGEEMTTTKSVADQVAEMKAGDWVEATKTYIDAEVVIKGKLRKNEATDELYIAEIFIACDDGSPSINLTSITRVPRPIPQEPEVFSFALLEGGDLVRKGNVRLDAKSWHNLLHNNFSDWTEIYPHITKLYTPSGELVEGFGYADKGEQNG